MNIQEIMQLIEQNVKADIYGDLYGHDRVAEELAEKIDAMQTEIDSLKRKVVDMSWELNPDRSGGQFTQEDLTRSDRL